MKTLSQHLKQAFNALEFANVGHLNALTTMLNKTEQRVAAGRIEPEHDSAEQDTSSAVFSN